jgi:hypothetical protein
MVKKWGQRNGDILIYTAGDLDREAGLNGHVNAGQSKEIKGKRVASRYSCGYC